MPLVYRKELFADLMPELPEIFYKHWLELGTNREEVPLAPAWGEYQQLENSGKLHIITIRDGEKLVGYFFGLAYRSLHYATTVYGHSDMFFILKDYRKGLAAGVILRKLLIEAIKLMRGLGVKRLYINHQRAHDLSRLLESLGMVGSNLTHCMLL